MFKRFIDDGFGIIRGNKKDVGTQINEFYQLRGNIFIDKWTVGNYVAYMDLYIFKGNNFLDTGILSIKVYQKPENRYMYIPYKSAYRKCITQKLMLPTCNWDKKCITLKLMLHTNGPKRV